MSQDAFYHADTYLRDRQQNSRIRQIAEKAEEYLGIEGYADKFYNYMGKGYFSLSSPVWANYGLDRGITSLLLWFLHRRHNGNPFLYTHAENGMLMKGGGGTSGYFGACKTSRGAN